MPPSTEEHWKSRVKSIKANNPSWGALRILETMKRVEIRFGRDYIGPSEATIRRILRREWDTMSARAQKRYLYFRWPESMERGDLPWEYSEAAIELLRWSVTKEDSIEPMFLQQSLKHRTMKHRPINDEERPSNKDVEWFWRVTQAMPNPPDKTSRENHTFFRYFLSQLLSDMETFNHIDNDLKRDLEEALVWETVNTNQIGKLLNHIRTRIRFPSARENSN